MFFESGKPNPNNENNLIKTIGLKPQYVIYGSISQAKSPLICLANIPTPDLIIYQDAFVVGPLVLLKKTTHAMYYKPGGLHQRSRETNCAYYNTCRWISGVQQLWLNQFLYVAVIYYSFFILVTCMMKQLDHCKIVKETFVVAEDILVRASLKNLMVFPKPYAKHSLEFSRFSPSYISSLIQKRKLGGNLFNKQT